MRLLTRLLFGIISSLWIGSSVKASELVPLSIGRVVTSTYSPDGKQIATAGTPHINIFDANTGSLVRRIETNADGIVALDWVGDLLVAGSRFRAKISVINLKNREEDFEFTAFERHLNSLDVSEDGTWILTTGADRSRTDYIKRFSIDGRLLGTHSRSGASPIRRAVHIPGTNQFLATSLLYSQLFSVDKVRPIKVFDRSNGKGILTSIAVNQAGTRFIETDDECGCAWLWDIERRRLVNKIEPEEFAKYADFVPSTDQIIIGEYFGKISFWESGGDNPTQTFKAHETSVTRIMFSPDGNQILSGAYGDRPFFSLERELLPPPNEIIKLWSLSDFTAPQAIITDHVPRLTFLRVSPDKRVFVTSHDNNSNVIMWSLETGLEIRRRQWESQTLPFPVVSPNSNELLIYGSNGNLEIWSLTSDEVVKLPRGESIRHAAYSPDGRQIAVGRSDGTIEILDRATLRPTLALKRPDSVRNVEFSPNASHLISGGEQGSIYRWDLQRGWLINIISIDPGERVYAYDIGSEGLVYTRSLGGESRVYDWEHGEVQLNLGEGVLTRARSTDDSLLFVGYNSGSGRLLDLPSGETQVQKPLHSTWILNAEFSPRGTMLITSGLDDKVKLWSLPHLNPVQTWEFEEQINSANFFEDGNKILISLIDGRIFTAENPLNTNIRVPLYDMTRTPQDTVQFSIGRSKGAYRVWQSEDLITWEEREIYEVTPESNTVEVGNISRSSQQFFRVELVR